MVALAKKSNRAITYGSPGTGTPTHLSGELLASMAQIKLVHVPYRGAVQALSDVLGGHIDFVFSAIPNVEGQIKSGNLRAVAVSGARRSPSLPETPTVSEAGLPGFETSIKYYLVAPAGTPRPIIDRLNVALQEALRDEKVRSRFAAEGFEPGIATLDEFAIDIERENSKWLPLIKSLGLKAE